jgi:hypothetical protein
MLKSERKANLNKWFDIIIDWENRKLKPSVYCKQFNLNLKAFYRYRSLYVESKYPTKVESSFDPPTKLIPIKISSDKKIKSKPSLTKPKDASAVEIKLPKLTINTNDKANIDFIYNLITRLTVC